jgi:hypothetical protein
MKTQIEIEFKIAVHESKIMEIINDESEWSPFQSELLNNYLMGRKALLWVLSPDDFIKEDVIKVLKYGISKGYKTTAEFSDNEVDEVLGWIKEI